MRAIIAQEAKGYNCILSHPLVSRRISEEAAYLGAAHLIFSQISQDIRHFSRILSSTDEKNRLL